MDMHMAASGNSLCGVPNGEAIFDDVFSLRNILQGNLVARRNFFLHSNRRRSKIQYGSGLQRLQSNCDVIRLVDSQKRRHVRLLLT